MKKAIKTFLIIVLVGAAVFGGLWYLKSRNGAVNENGTTNGGGITLRDFFPFGSDTKVTDEEPLTPSTETKDEEPATSVAKEQNLVQISGNPVAGFGFAMVNVAPDGNAVAKEYVTVKAGITFTKDLARGSKDNQVKELQKLFNQCEELQLAVSGVGSVGKETTSFDEKTENSLKIFQTMFRNIDPATNAPLDPSGKVDAQTRAKLNTPFDCTKPSVDPKVEQKDALRFVQKATGHVYETLVENTNIAKITNTTIPRVQEAVFIPNTNSVILRYLDDKTKAIQSFLGTIADHTIGKDTGQTELKGTFLEENILDLSASPSNGKLFSLSEFNNGTVGDVSTPGQNKTTQVFSSPFTEWKSQYINANTVVLTTKASSRVAGYAYVVNTDTKSFSKLIGGIAGLTTLVNPNKTKFVYGNTVGIAPAFTLFDQTKNSRLVLPTTTLPSKCVWKDTDILYCGVPTYMPDGQYPDDWYQGLVSFSDKIWLIDTKNGTSTIISDPLDEVGQDIDVVSPKLDSAGDKLFFINKKDSSLWELKLN